MYFWRIKDLKGRLRTSPLSDRETLPYLVAYTVPPALATLVPPAHYNNWDLWSGLFSVGLNILGPIWVYRQNGGSSGHHFLQRFLAVGWVSIVRLLLIASPALLIFYMVASSEFSETPGTDLHDALVVIGLQLFFFQRVGSHVCDVAFSTPAAPLQATRATDTTA